VETIKSGSGGWKFLSRWIDVSAESIRSDMAMRAIGDHAGYIAAMLQQLSYSTTVIVGSFLVINGQITMGALIACSILGGRILAPVAMIPGLMVQRAHTKATLAGLEKIYALQTDQGNERQLTPDTLRGEFRVEEVKFTYAGSLLNAMSIDQLSIKAGERVAILGPIGAGKSTILRLLSGLYRPQQGRILIDGLDMANINRLTLNQHIGYLQQDHRLFVGTLRENLLIGLPDPGDEVLRQVMERTGLLRLVSAHPKGLDLPIQEGGRGLSGGQRQLVAFTRLLLCRPDIFLLDEPTASMDEDLERHCLGVLNEEISGGRTLVVVTHKPAFLPMVERVIVVVGKPAPNAKTFTYDYVLTQKDVDAVHNPSPISDVLTLTLDTTAPVKPTLSLQSDNGSSSTDKITNDGTVKVDGLEAGVSWQYSTDSGVTWSAGSGSRATSASRHPAWPRSRSPTRRSAATT